MKVTPCFLVYDYYRVGKTCCLHLPKNMQLGEGEEVGRRNRKMETEVKLEWQEEKVEME
jgi:hypothetical protein